MNNERPMPDTYCFDGMCIPSSGIESIKTYVNFGVPTGSFLDAVLNNDLRAACERADNINIQVIPAYVAYLYNHAPVGSWGYAGATDSWTKRLKDDN